VVLALVSAADDVTAGPLEDGRKGVYGE